MITVVAVTAASPAPAQPAADVGSVHGSVLDEATGQGLAGAVATLTPIHQAPDPGGPTGDAAVPRAYVTGPDGSYRFDSVPPGRYRLRVNRIGFSDRSVEIELLRPSAARISVALEVAPVALSTVLAEQQPASLFQRSRNRSVELEEVRRASERLRQQLYLSPDARMVTLADVMDGVTLGEGDIFRALHRFPGIGTRDDYTAELWTRGSPWSHTQVTFDGVPLFNPLHAIGVLSAVTPEVLGAVFLHPGVRPAMVGGGAAGVVDLRSRPGASDGRVGGSVDVSMASSKIALEQSLPGGPAWLLAVRRSNLQLLGGGMKWLGLDSLDLPFAFHDVAGRIDVPLGTHATLSGSGLVEADRLDGDVPGIIERNRARWGGGAAQVTLRARLGAIELAQSIGLSRFSAETDASRVQTRDPTRAWTEPPSENSLAHTRASTAIRPAEGAAAADSWAFGLDLVTEGGVYDGPKPRYHAVKPESTERLRRRGGVRVAAGWGEATVALGGRLIARPGLRLEVGSGDVANAGPIRAAPRLAMRYQISPANTFSIGLGRSWQYGQAIALAGPSIHPAFHASQFWVWADRRTPALRADLASMGAESWLSDAWLGSLTAFVRRTDGMALPDPTPGRLDGRRPLFVPAVNSARGTEASIRRIGSRWSASAGYSFTVSNVAAAGYVFPSPADRRHILDATGGVRLADPIRLSIAYTAASGAPFTRAYTRALGDCSFFGFECGSTASYSEEPNGERTAAHRSLDASIQLTRRLGPFDAAAYAQVRNLVNRENASTYAGTVAVGRVPARDGSSRVVWEDRFESGLPRLLLVGVRANF
ncbi:MAG TPA: TonB-dependent receptor [Longimicrobiaceae bacterium]|nr:TonB-dependent receptor [Longimicrobiaceae bacterium]